MRMELVVPAEDVQATIQKILESAADNSAADNTAQLSSLALGLLFLYM